MLGNTHHSDIHLSAEFWSTCPVVLLWMSQADSLEQPFSLDEIIQAIFDSSPNKAPGPDGFPFLFYQNSGCGER